jgi:hypothetical protein
MVMQRRQANTQRNVTEEHSARRALDVQDQNPSDLARN